MYPYEPAHPSDCSLPASNDAQEWHAGIPEMNWLVPEGPAAGRELDFSLAAVSRRGEPEESIPVDLRNATILGRSLAVGQRDATQLAYCNPEGYEFTHLV